ncbi:hypothetical protein WR25_06377 isoform A [Diploscapter pachys]|uniref:Uncharacterized protein n=1 Tax=Diploscapter pachys TaxID=2018661 RepID=A0A2A2KMI9_9BILA|nr:hypothetical protein WR25_06377 isoform A [Diploscapter pachys]
MVESEEADEGEAQQPVNQPQQGSESLQGNGQDNGESMGTGTDNEQQQPQELAAGMRVFIKSIDPKHAERLHENNHLPWDIASHPHLINHIGIIKSIDDVTHSAVVVFYTWAIYLDKRKKIMVVDNIWHLDLLVPCNHVHFTVGDRAIIESNSANQFSLLVVTIKEINEIEGSHEPSYVLLPTSGSLPSGNPFTWIASRKPGEVMIPIYSGRNYCIIYRDRNEEAHNYPMRLIHGIVEEESALLEGVRKWSSTGQAVYFQMAVQRYPHQILTANEEIETPIARAIRDANWPAVVTLLAMRGEQEQPTDARDRTLLHIAAERGDVTVLEGLLLLMPRDINKQNSEGDTCLHIVARNQNAACLDRLLNVPIVQCNIQNLEGNSPMHVVCEAQETSTKRAMLSRLLTNSKVNPYLLNARQQTPMEIAIVNDYAKTVELLVQCRPIQLNLEHFFNRTPLHLSALFAKIRIVDLLISLNADINRVDMENRTALHLAVVEWGGSADVDVSRLACVHSLVNAGCQLNLPDKYGYTVLHLLVNACNTLSSSCPPVSQLYPALSSLRYTSTLDDMVKKLKPHWQLSAIAYIISRGGDMSIRGRNGLTPVEICIDENMRQTLQVLQTLRPKSCVSMTVRQFDRNMVALCTFNCQDNAADVQLVPCGHRVICLDCAQITPLRRCPMCYRSITMAIDKDGDELILGGKKRKGDDNVEMKRAAEKEARRQAEIEKQNEIKALREKLEQLEMELSCSICMDKRPDVIFQCGHTACAGCTKQLKVG